MCPSLSLCVSNIFSHCYHRLQPSLPPSLRHSLARHGSHHSVRAGRNRSISTQTHPPSTLRNHRQGQVFSETHRQPLPASSSWTNFWARSCIGSHCQSASKRCLFSKIQLDARVDRYHQSRGSTLAALAAGRAVDWKYHEESGASVERGSQGCADGGA